MMHILIGAEHLTRARAQCAPGSVHYSAGLEINVAPTAADDSVTFAENDSAQVINVLANDSDPAGTNDPLSVISVNTTGTVTLNAGVANSMIVKVVNSLKSYDKGNLAAAGNQLRALKNEITAKVKPSSITAADATLAFSLIDALYDSMTP